MDIKYRAVTASNWRDFEELFEGSGGPKFCWCMVWRKMIIGGSRSSAADKKESIVNYVRESFPIGILGYKANEPIAWCSIAPRETYRNLSGNTSIDHVWSLVCFFIKRSYRRQGMSERLIAEAIRYAKDNKARYVEAYPIDPEGTSYRFMGFRQVFEKLGFVFTHKAGTRRNVMLLKL